MFQRIVSLLILMLSLATVSVFAERNGTLTPDNRRQSNFTLTIHCNVPNAIIQINNDIVRGTRFDLPPAVYQITVRAPGYTDFHTNISLKSDQTITANLQRANSHQDDSNLFINSNVKGAQVFINDTLVGIVGARFTVPQGSYQIRVSAPGFQDFVTRIQLRSSQTINAILNPTGFMLTISANVPGAQVFINNSQVGLVGSAFPLAVGSYQLRVSAPGYMDFVSNITMNGNQNITANLNPLNFTLSVSANVKGAQVYLNNSLVGATDQVYSLQPGSYQLRISAPGYQDFSSNIQLNGNQVINAVLQGLSGTLVVEMPRNTVMLVFIDGALQKGFGPISLPAGQHRVRFELGFMSAESIVSIIAGQNVVVAPTLSILVK